jgi:steroid 5-alpha reductase family enzyme
VWILIAIVIEGVALVSVLAILATRRTHFAFVAGFNTMALVTAIYVWNGGLHPRALIVVAMVVVYLARMNWVLVVWSGSTALAKLDERTPFFQKLVFAFVLANATGWGYCLPFYFATRHGEPLALADGIAIGLYVVGTVFHFGGDYQKRRFKLHEGGRGKLLDTGFWALCRHPNYFGDFLIYISFAVVGGSIWGWVAPLLNLVQYAFDAIPKNERWAAGRYGPAWEAYRATTKAFVPFLL